MLTRKEIEDWEVKNLSPLAMKSKDSGGRKYPEPEHPYRSAYQRDRDRILHSAAFRRLEYKTQVYIYHEGDYYRTRLTHTLEVSQIGRTIAKILGLNEDLTEALCLVHDVGHTPFGHAGEEILNELTKEEGGFDHNLQGLRVVDLLEERYPHFPGLNLSRELREGILKHKTAYDNADRYLQNFPELRTDRIPSMEAQVMDVADEIAYDSHDLDDGIKSNLLYIDDLKKLTIWKTITAKIKKEYTNLNRNLFNSLVIRNIIDSQVTDLIVSTSDTIQKTGIKDWKEVTRHQTRIVVFSKEMDASREELRKFLYDNLYLHRRVVKMSDKGKRLLKGLFEVYCNNQKILHPDFQKRIATEGLKRTVCDYIAGMTDRYALEEYRKLFDPNEKI